MSKGVGRSVQGAEEGSRDGQGYGPLSGPGARHGRLVAQVSAKGKAGGGVGPARQMLWAAWWWLRPAGQALERKAWQGERRWRLRAAAG